MSENAKIDWDAFDKPERKFFKPEVGKEYVITFNRLIGSEVREIKDNQTGDLKQVPALLVEVGSVDGEELNVRWEVTSVRLVKMFKEYSDKGLLLTKKFALKRTGTGTQTLYTLYPTGDKPKSTKMPAKTGSFSFLEQIIDKQAEIRPMTMKVKLAGWKGEPTEVALEDGTVKEFSKDAMLELPEETAKMLIGKGIAVKLQAEGELG